MKKAKVLFTLSSLTSVAMLTGFVGLSSRCYNKNSIVTDYQQKKLTVSYNSPLSPRAFEYDNSAGYGSQETLHQEGRSTVETLIRTKVEGKSEVVYDLKAKKHVVKKPTQWFRKLGLADGILVEKKDGTQEVFDNDKHEIAPEKGADGYYSLTSMQAFSNDEKSINSKKFEELLTSGQVKSIKFLVRQNVNWVNAKNEKTKYKVTAKDFYYSWWRTRLLTKSVRLSNGGTEDIDKAIGKVLEPKSTLFTAKHSFPNAYLFSLANVDADKFDKEEEFTGKSTVNGVERETVNFVQKSESRASDWITLLDKIISNSQEFIPAPSEYIKEHADNPLDVQKIGGTNEDLAKANEEIKKATGKAKEFGAYWYGNHLGTTLFSGAYIYDASKTNLKEQTLTYNKHFWDKEFLKREDKIETISAKHTSSILDPKIYDKQQWDDYEKGLTAFYRYAALTDAQKQLVNANPEKYGLGYGKEYNTSSFLNEYALLPTPAPFVDANKNQEIITDPKLYGYNDNYVKLLYGKSLTDVISGNISSISKEFLGGKGLRFRTLVNAGINFNYLARTVNPKYEAWLAKVATHSKINKGPQTPKEVDEQINRYYGIKNDYSQTEAITNKTSSEYIQNHADNPWRTPIFNTVKEELKKLLDDFYTENNLDANQKIEWSVYWPYSNISTNYAQMYANYIKAVQDLDPRLKVNFLQSTQRNDIFNYRFYGKVNYNYSGWGYDYNGISSGLDGMSWNLGHLMPTLSYLIANKDSEEVKNLYKAFPTIKTLADYLEKWYEDNTNGKGLKFTPNLDLKYWHLLPNKYVNDYADYLSKAKYENGKVVVDESASQTFDPMEFSSNFWFAYQSSHENDHLIKLTQELSNYIGFTPDTKFFTSPGFTEKLINPHYEIPTSPSDSTLTFEDAKILK